MITDVVQLDDDMYMLQVDSEEYLVFIHHLSPSMATLHVVTVQPGESGFYEFGDETYRTFVWGKDYMSLNSFLHGTVTFIIEEDMDLSDPVPLYLSSGGHLRGSQPSTTVYPMASLH